MTVYSPRYFWIRVIACAVISQKLWHDHSAQQQQLLELLHHSKASRLRTLRGYNVEYSGPTLSLKTN